MKNVQIIRIQYETKDSSWNANIAATNPEQAVKFLQQSVKGITMINSIERRGRLDAVTPNVRNKIVGKVEPVIKEVYRCPWCDNTYDTAHGLKVHLAVHKNPKRKIKNGDTVPKQPTE